MIAEEPIVARSSCGAAFDDDYSAPAPQAAAVREPEPTHCECGGAFIFDPSLEGETAGGVHRIGWLVCASCGETCVTRRGRTDGGPWKLAGGGRSVHADGLKIRAESTKADVGAVMTRIAKLPTLEAALRAIARGDGPAIEIARRALEET